jgi:hypothetical protein
MKLSSLEKIIKGQYEVLYGIEMLTAKTSMLFTFLKVSQFIWSFCWGNHVLIRNIFNLTTAFKFLFLRHYCFR